MLQWFLHILCHLRCLVVRFMFTSKNFITENLICVHFNVFFWVLEVSSKDSYVTMDVTFFEFKRFSRESDDLDDLHWLDCTSGREMENVIVQQLNK